MKEEKRFSIADFAEIKPVACPCGMSRRAFMDSPGGCVSFHIVKIKKDAQVHYHKKHIEIYYILEGTGYLELDGEKIPVKPGVSVLIRELCRHRAVGKLTVANVSLPRFDAEDEWFDE